MKFEFVPHPRFNFLESFAEAFDDKASMEQRWEDGIQGAVAIGLAFAGGPVTVVAGGIALAGWELYEYMRDNN